MSKVIKARNEFTVVVKRELAKQHRDANMTTRVLVRDIMNSPVVSAALTDSVKDVALKMKDQKVGSIIIMEGENPVGIVSDWDIVSNAVVKDVKPSTLKVSDIMQKLHTIEGEEGVTEAARILRQHNIKRLGVVYKKRLVGIISALLVNEHVHKQRLSANSETDALRSVGGCRAYITSLVTKANTFRRRRLFVQFGRPLFSRGLPA